jgi:hypothetical protein
MDPEIREIVLPLLSGVQKSGITGGVDTSQGKSFLEQKFNFAQYFDIIFRRFQFRKEGAVEV